MDHESPTLLGNQEYWKSSYFGFLGSWKYWISTNFGILGAWKYWISKNLGSWDPGNIGYQPTWCTGFLEILDINQHGVLGSSGGRRRRRRRPNNSPTWPGPWPKAGRKKYPVRGIPHFDVIIKPQIKKIT